MANKFSLFIILCFFFGNSFSQTNVDPEARRLTILSFETSKNKLKSEKANELDAIAILDQAISVDSNYFMAYYNKFVLQRRLKMDTCALKTGLKMISMKPEHAQIVVGVGIIYERIGDSKMATKYFENALLIYNSTIDTMNVNNKFYRRTKYDKAFDLVLLYRQKAANEILTELYNTEKDDILRRNYDRLMNPNWRLLIFGPTGRL